MRKKVIVGNLSVQAIAGTHVVMLGMDLPEDKCNPEHLSSGRSMLSCLVWISPKISAQDCWALLFAGMIIRRVKSIGWVDTRPSQVLSRIQQRECYIRHAGTPFRISLGRIFPRSPVMTIPTISWRCEEIQPIHRRKKGLV